MFSYRIDVVTFFGIRRSVCPIPRQKDHNKPNTFVCDPFHEGKVLGLLWSFPAQYVHTFKRKHSEHRRTRQATVLPVLQSEAMWLSLDQQNDRRVCVYGSED